VERPAISFVPREWSAVLALLVVTISPVQAKTKTTPQELRQAYLTRVQQQPMAQSETGTLGSLWAPAAPLGQLSTDFKAKALNDIITIVVAELTSAQSSGNLTSQRTFATQSSITGLLAQVSTRGVDPLLGANSSTQLKGQGQATAGTQLTTRLTGRVIAVLTNGNLVVEAERQVYMNNQHENMIIRGVVQPADITGNNTILSTSMADLEIEMKGKGIISDSTRPPNPITRAILWLFGF
jgi:flagellar L-ring protein precursor FlgH